ncbi:MAG: hypothetical protein CME83_02940 [Candidatus Heimdallarchaeota archaeon]|nr:hypothetical protein [Candidatus Heimdallarchaeota archaeon]|tara:strand:- start:3112 stop:3297 length:186 start_codon:yes stop_codon:yes gene_type:complete
MNGEIIANKEIGMMAYKDHPTPSPVKKSIMSRKRQVEILKGNENNHVLYIVWGTVLFLVVG